MFAGVSRGAGGVECSCIVVFFLYWEHGDGELSCVHGFVGRDAAYGWSAR